MLLFPERYGQSRYWRSVSNESVMGVSRWRQNRFMSRRSSGTTAGSNSQQRTICNHPLMRGKSILFLERMSLRQLMRMPRREPMSNSLLAHLIFRHWRNELVVNEEAIDVQRLVARRIGRLELNSTARFCILNAGEQRRFEQLRFVFEFFHVSASATCMECQ